MDRWALEQAVAMLEAKTEQGHLSPEEERHVRELLANGDATRALEKLAAHDGTVDAKRLEVSGREGETETETLEFAERDGEMETEGVDFADHDGDPEREKHDYAD